MRWAAHGQRECVHCAYYHPERASKPCSAFGALQNKHKDCSLYHEDMTPPEQRVLWVGTTRGVQKDEQ